MKLQQLRYLIEIEKQGLNISRASAVLCTSQSGISKQVAILEEELGVEIFARNGRKLTDINPVGEKIIDLAKKIISQVDDIELVAEQFTDQPKTIAIATTHTQARYVLPVIVERFLSIYPEINLNLQQGTPEQVAALLESNEVDIAIATEALANRDSLMALPCYQWSRSVIVRKDHPLANKQKLSLEDIVAYPVITYVQGFTGRYKQDEVFKKNKLQPDVVLTAVDADVIKTYVRLGLGIGIIADMAFNPNQDDDLQALNVEHLFGISTSYVAIRKDKYIKPYIPPFINMVATHLTPSLVQKAIASKTVQERSHLFSKLDIPLWKVVEEEGEKKVI